MPISDSSGCTNIKGKYWFIRMKRTFVNLKGTIRQSASLPDATLRPYRRYTTADRQAVPGRLLSGADVLPAPLWALYGIPSGLREASSRDALCLPRYNKYSQSGRTEIFLYQTLMLSIRPDIWVLFFNSPP